MQEIEVVLLIVVLVFVPIALIILCASNDSIKSELKNCEIKGQDKP